MREGSEARHGFITRVGSANPTVVSLRPGGGASSFRHVLMIGFSDQAEYCAAGNVLRRANYNQQGIAQRLGTRQVLSVPAVEIPPWLSRTRDLSPLDVLIRLFLLGAAVPASAVKDALAPMSLETWIRAGLLNNEVGTASVSSTVKITAVEHLVLAADLPQGRQSPSHADIVMPPALTSMEVARAMVQHDSRRTLDLGTGSGILGLLAAAHSQQVVLTDSNPRAAEIASFNSRLNRIANVDVRQGHLFDPVRDERFDLIVSNPPFVISPANRLLFRDSGIRGDDFCRRMILEAAKHLHPGGYCQVQCNCIHSAGEDWKQALADWFKGLDCDVLVWLIRTEAISDYAMTWIIGTEAHDIDEMPQIYDRWMNYYSSHKIEAISYVLVTLRRTDGGHAWTCIDDTPRRIVGPCSDEISAAFAHRQRYGAMVEDATLMGSRLTLNPDVQIEQSHTMATNGVQPLKTRLHKTGSTQFTIRVDPHIGAFVARCDGRRTIADIFNEMSRALGGHDNTSVRQTMAILRSLMDRGILLSADMQSQRRRH